jgi:hypothetical protein
MKVRLQKLKNNLKNVVSTLPPESKAELYFQKRKHSLKLGMQGEQKKFIESIRKCDEFYKENAIGENYHSFHKAHHKFLDWSTDYVHFQRYQQLLASADRERDIFKSELQVIKTLDYLLDNYKTLGFDFTMDNALEIVKIVKERTEKTIKEYDETIPQIEQQVEDDEYFHKNNYFQDMDVLGYRDLSWKKFRGYMFNIGTNNGPVKHKN